MPRPLYLQVLDDSHVRLPLSPRRLARAAVAGRLFSRSRRTGQDAREGRMRRLARAGNGHHLNRAGPGPGPVEGSPFLLEPRESRLRIGSGQFQAGLRVRPVIIQTGLGFKYKACLHFGPGSRISLAWPGHEPDISPLKSLFLFRLPLLFIIDASLPSKKMPMRIPSKKMPMKKGRKKWSTMVGKKPAMRR